MNTPLQDVLAKVGGGAAMTIAEATMIADNALEHTVRSLLAALQAPEILKSTQGALSPASWAQLKPLKCKAGNVNHANAAKL